MKKVIIILEIIIVLLEIVVLVKLNKKNDIGYHEPSDCMIINNEEIYCKIAPAVDY